MGFPACKGCLHAGQACTLAKLARWRNYRRLAIWSAPFSQPDGEARAGLDGVGQEWIAGRLFGTALQPDIAMLDLFGAEALDGCFQGCLIGTELRLLLLVMLIDHFLDGNRAGHGGFWA